MMMVVVMMMMMIVRMMMMKSVNSNLTAPTSSHASAAKYRLTVQNNTRPVAPVTKEETIKYQDKYQDKYKYKTMKLSRTFGERLI